MSKNSLKRRAYRIRKKLRAVSKGRDRLSVFKSGNHIYAQIIDDSNSRTLVSASTLDKEIKRSGKSNCNKESAIKVGKLLVKRARERSIKIVVFDKGPHKYHGVIKALADEAREGLEF